MTGCARQARYLLAGVLCLFAGCADLPWQDLASREHAAQEAYYSGSSIGGNGRALLLFGHGRWEMWGSTCTESHRIARGTLVRTGDQLALTDAGGTAEVLYVYEHHGVTYLPDSAQLHALEQRPKILSEGIILKKQEDQ